MRKRKSQMQIWTFCDALRSLIKPPVWSVPMPLLAV